jgi:hypothetical protein
MGIPTTGLIRMGGTGERSIVQEKSGTTTGTPTVHTEVSLRGLSVDGVNDFRAGAAFIDIPGSPNQTAPYKMSDFRGYSQSFWPSSAPGSITTNETFIMDVDAADELGNDVVAATVLNMSLNTTNKTLSWFFGNDADGSFDADGTSTESTDNTNTNTITYNGTITSLEARMVYTSLTHQYSGGGDGFTSNSFAGRSWAAHHTSSHMDGSSLANNGDSASSGVQKTKLSGTDSVATRSALSGTYGYKTMRTTTGNCSIGMFATCTDVPETFDYSSAYIGPTDSGSSIYWQIKITYLQHNVWEKLITLYNVSKTII